MSDEGQIQAGFYKGRAIAGSEQYGTTKSGGDQIAIDIGIPSLNRTLTTFLFFTDAAAPYSIERLRACGWTGDDLSNLVGVDANEIDVSIKYETFDGKQQMKVDIATGGGRVKLANQMDDKAKRAFAARMKAVIKGGGPAPSPKPANGGARRAPASGGADQGFGPAGSDDEIPF